MVAVPIAILKARIPRGVRAFFFGARRMAHKEGSAYEEKHESKAEAKKEGDKPVFGGKKFLFGKKMSGKK